MRSKEEAHDYRYFPDPDLLPLEFDDTFVAELKAHLPELPDAKKARFIAEYGLSPYDASVLVAEREQADYFEAVAKGRDGKAAANWVINELFGRLNKEGKDVTTSPVSAAQLGGLVDLIGEGVISGRIAKDLFEILWSEGGDPRAIVEARGMKRADRRQSRQGRAGQGQADHAGLVRRPGDEGLRRQGQPAGPERDPEGEAGDRVSDGRRWQHAVFPGLRV